MWVFISFIFLFPASARSSSTCPKPVTAPEALVATLGSCLYIPCRYDLCQAGPSPHPPLLRWLHHPHYDPQQQKFWGRAVEEHRGTTGSPQGDCSLTIPRVYPESAGVYGLRLMANASRRYYKDLRWMHPVTVNVTGTPPAPHLWPDPAPLTQGQKSNLGCWVPPTCPEKTPTLTWEGPVSETWGAHLDTWIPPTTVVSYEVVGTLLTFEPSGDHDGTSIHCILRGSDGKIISQASRQLQVHYAPRDVRVVVTPPSPVHEGREVTLSCQDLANPPSHTYTWSLEGHILPQHGAQVLLGPTKATHGGTYRCQATNRLGTTESPPTSLEVYYPPRDVRVVVTPPSPVHEGREVTLSCQDLANPPSHTYTWSLGGHILPQRRAQVLLGPTKATHGGTYRCQATNHLGTTESPPTSLEVYYPPRAATLETSTPLPALLGSRVILNCRLSPAHPTPTVQWLRNDRPEAEGPAHTLSFLANPAHAGSYRCIGRNPAGSASSLPLPLRIWYAPQAVQVLQHPRGPVLAGGGPVRLRCEVGAADPPQLKIRWFKDEEELPVETPDLVLPSPHPTDAAAYSCQAQNEVGVTRSPPSVLEVRYAPQGVELVVGPGQRVEEKTNITLGCRGAAHPPPELFEWFRDGRSLGQSRKGLWVLPAVGAGSGGRYHCRITNQVASADSDDVIVTIYYSTPTILRRTFLALAVGLSSLLALVALGFLLHRRWKRQVAADEEPVVEPPRTFFLCKKKVPGSTQPSRGPGDTINPTTPEAPPGSALAPRLRGDTVVYSVLKKNDGAAKATEGPDYENVPAGPSRGDRNRDGDRDGTLVYATLALAPLGTPQGHAEDVGDTVEYATLRH